MSYKIKFNVDPSKTITVEDQTVNNELSISFVGKNYINYASVISENFLHLMESFANTSEPKNPVQGQLWYDSTVGANYLKLYNGIEWKPVGFIEKSADPPTNPSIGDLWINPTVSTKQLMMYTGSTDPNKEWALIGPENVYGNTGLFIQSIEDVNVDPKLHEVIILSSQNQTESDPDTVAILSRDTFTPREIRDSLKEFDFIQSGINLPSSIDSEIKLHGTATRAEALIVVTESGKELVFADKFLRNDIPNTVYHQFNIENIDGLVIKNPANFLNPSEFSITVNELAVNLSALSNDKNIIFNVKNNDVITPAIFIDSTGKIGIGTIQPTESVDILGNIKIKGQVEVINTQDNILLSLTDTDATLNVNLTTKNITVDKIKYNSNLPAVIEGSQYNSFNKFIGYLEEESFLTGTWIGNSIFAVPSSDNSGDDIRTEQLIMSISTTGIVSIDGYFSSDSNTLINHTQQTGKIYRVDKSTPCIYFYSENAQNISEYGRKLYSVIVNKSGDTATFTLLANNGTEEYNQIWRNIVFFKIADEFDYKETVRAVLDNFNESWK